MCFVAADILPASARREVAVVVRQNLDELETPLEVVERLDTNAEQSLHHS